MNGKQRLSASVDADLIEAAEDAVASGRSGSVSAWVNEALRAKCDQDRRLQALDAFVQSVQRRVTGIVRLKLFKGDLRVVGRKSPFALPIETASRRAGHQEAGKPAERHVAEATK